MFEVYLSSAALEAAENHFRDASWEKKEALGLLLGKAYLFEGRPYVVAEEYLTAENDATSVSVKFTRDAFTSLSEKLSGGNNIVGWAHSHPDFGCFLSSIDLAAHASFFDEPYHFALVVDPIRRKRQCFKVSEGTYRLVSYAVIRKK